MKTEKETSAFCEQYILTPKELKLMRKYLKLLTDREELIGWLDNYSYFFADWSIIINESVHERIAKKQLLNVDCEKECEMLDNLSFLFVKMAYFSGMLSNWHRELDCEKENTEKMIEQGHP